MKIKIKRWGWRGSRAGVANDEKVKEVSNHHEKNKTRLP